MFPAIWLRVFRFLAHLCGWICVSRRVVLEEVVATVWPSRGAHGIFQRGPEAKEATREDQESSAGQQRALGEPKETGPEAKEATREDQESSAGQQRSHAACCDGVITGAPAAQLVKGQTSGVIGITCCLL